MNYFEFFGLQPAFGIDKEGLRKLFLENSRNYHPDFAKAKGIDAAEALEKSTLNNEAYKTLSDDQLRTHYMLKINNLLGDGKEQLPMEFLMEMMEINEQIAELQMDLNADSLSSVQGSYKTWMDEVSKSLEEHQAEFDKTGAKDALESVKEFYLKSKYLLRIKESIDTFAAP